MNQIKSELRKLTGTNTWIWLTFAAAFIVAGVTALTFLLLKTVASNGGDPLGLGINTQAGVEDIYSQVGFFLGWLFALILGAVAVTSEFRFGTVVPTFLTTPQRERPILAKMVAVGIIGGLMGLVVVIAGYATATVLLLTTSHAGVNYSHLLLIALGCMLAYVLLSIVGVAVGALVRNQIVAVVLVIVWVVLAQQILAIVTAIWHLDYISKWFPQNAVAAVVAAASPQADQLPAWGGALTLIAYAVVLAALGFFTTLRRDVA